MFALCHLSIIYILNFQFFFYSFFYFYFSPWRVAVTFTFFQVRTAFCDSCMEITVESNGGSQENQPNRLFFLNHTGWALLISWLEKWSFWQLLIIKISLSLLWSFHKGRLPVGEHGSILDRRQRSVRSKILWNCVSQSTSYSLLRHITPDPMSNPVIYYLKWVVSETVG